MIETRSVITKGDKCEGLNSVPLQQFLGSGYKLKKDIIATCQLCNKGYLVALDDTLIH